MSTDFVYVFTVTKEEHIKDMFQVSVPAVDDIFFVGSKFSDKEKAVAFAEDVANKKWDCLEDNWIVKLTKDASWNVWVGSELKWRAAL